MYIPIIGYLCEKPKVGAIHETTSLRNLKIFEGAYIRGTTGRVIHEGDSETIISTEVQICYFHVKRQILNGIDKINFRPKTYLYTGKKLTLSTSCVTYMG